MNKQILQMKYHPAKKEVEFHRFQNGKEIPIRNDSRLMKYMNLKGKFILQDYGNEFFDDIAITFDGLKSVDIEVITTKVDYEDFEQMVEFYNQELNNIKINSKLIEELPSMEQIFSEVKKYGENAIQILQNQHQKLFDIKFKSKKARERAEDFAIKINEEINNIKDKIKDLEDNNVSLCFTGVYSSGKSALINAILGYKILPENIKSETAKMFKICSPKENENIKIKFYIEDDISELEWNSLSHSFEFTKGPSENNIRADIQELINDMKQKDKLQFEQINVILVKLNSLSEVSSEIEVLFPVALDNKTVQFTIYDTPGTDSNYIEHQHILNKALEEQTQSILVFVAKPDGLEGTGNNVLLNYLKEMEEKNSKTSIDINRSLFVINKADGQTAESRKILQYQKIKNKDDEEFSINLANKKLFFTSAMYAYVAKAVTNGIATESEKGLFQGGKYSLAIDENPISHCYRQNRCATSEYATKKMIDDCELELQKSKEKGDDAMVLSICSGLYALEREIVKYGQKYASAVKAFAIIDSVNKVLTKLSNKADSLKKVNEEEISNIDRNIKEMREIINESIENEYKNRKIDKNENFPRTTLKKLKLDSETVNKIFVEEMLKDINKILKKRWFSNEIKVRESDKVKINNLLTKNIEEFTDEFRKTRRNLLEVQRNEFMKFAKDTIMKNGNISEAAKKYFLYIPNPTIPKFNKIDDIDKIYNDSRRKKNILIFEFEYLDEYKFKQDIEIKLGKISREIMDYYREEYIESLNNIVHSIKCNFESNLNEYSLNMKAMIEDKKGMTELGEKIFETAQNLIECKQQLNKIIWSKSDDKNAKVKEKIKEMV